MIRSLMALSLVEYLFAYIVLLCYMESYPRTGFHFYADSTQLYVHLSHKNVAHAFDRL